MSSFDSAMGMMSLSSGIHRIDDGYPKWPGEYGIGLHRLYRNRYLYNCEYEPKEDYYNGFGEDGRLFEIREDGYRSSDVNIYYLCVMNCAIDCDDWKAGTALIPVYVNKADGSIDMVISCDENMMERIMRDSVVYKYMLHACIPFRLGYDSQNIFPTSLMIDSKYLQKLKDNTWFKQVVYDYNIGEATTVHEFYIDHAIPYAEKTDQLVSIPVFESGYPVELEPDKLWETFCTTRPDKLADLQAKYGRR